MKGAARIISSRLRADRADAQTRQGRELICMTCKDSVLIQGRRWCGEPLVETDTTCGCRCDLKGAIASEMCPQGKWPDLVAITVEGEHG